MRRFFIPIIVLIIFTTACGKLDVNTPGHKGKDEMPTLRVIVDGEIFDTATGAYCWSFKNSSECADASGDPFDYVDYSPPIVVQPGKAIELRFSEEPDSFTIDLQVNKQQFTTIKENPFGSPLEEGMYGYDVSTKWGKDHIHFHFVLDVRQQGD